MNCQTPKSLHKHYKFFLVIVSSTSHGCYDIVLSLLHTDVKKSPRRSQGWNTISQLQNPCLVLAEVQSERQSQRQRLESIYTQRKRVDPPACEFETIYKTRQPINNLFEKLPVTIYL